MSKVDQLKEEYHRLLHAMQSGVAFDADQSDRSPKHLRVGVNSAITQNSAIVLLLMSKGVIGEEEYWESMVSCFKEEVERYRQRISKQTGQPVVLK